MRWWLCVAVAVLAPAAWARADDDPKPEQWKKMYDEVVEQLKNAQERKNQLATENEQLKAKAGELQKQLDAANGKAADLQKQVSASAEKTFFFRSHYAAWQEFLKRYPRLLARWRVFLENDVLIVPNDLPPLNDADWPLPAAG